MSKAPRSSLPGIPRRRTAVTLFISYSHQDHVWMKRLLPVLNAIPGDDRLRNGPTGLSYVHDWHDQKLDAGHPWDDEIKQALDEMDIFVPLVSMDFLASGYIRDVELKRAQDRYESREIVVVVPILLYDVNLESKCAFLHQFNPLPAFGRPWQKYGDRRTALPLIDDGLWAAIEGVQRRKNP